jgi:hypothetical protein
VNACHASVRSGASVLRFYPSPSPAPTPGTKLSGPDGLDSGSAFVVCSTGVEGEGGVEGMAMMQSIRLTLCAFLFWC